MEKKSRISVRIDTKTKERALHVLNKLMLKRDELRASRPLMP